MKTMAPTPKLKLVPRQPEHAPARRRRPIEPPLPPPPAVESEQWEPDIEEPAPIQAIVDDEMPEWATLEPNPEVWWKVLSSFGVDTTARASVFALAQMNDAGREAANGIT